MAYYSLYCFDSMVTSDEAIIYLRNFKCYLDILLLRSFSFDTSSVRYSYFDNLPHRYFAFDIFQFRYSVPSIFCVFAVFCGFDILSFSILRSIFCHVCDQLLEALCADIRVIFCTFCENFASRSPQVRSPAHRNSKLWQSWLIYGPCLRLVSNVMLDSTCATYHRCSQLRHLSSCWPLLFSLFSFALWFLSITFRRSWSNSHYNI